jgi:hypothetical protein
MTFQTLDADLSMLELAVKHATRDGVDHMATMAARFVDKSQSFAGQRGIDGSMIEGLHFHLCQLAHAHRLDNFSRLRISIARRNALRAISDIRTATPLLASEAYETHLPSWLRP